jgi:peptidoglycan/LPS O-acetylase OafA/YrhL
VSGERWYDGVAQVRGVAAVLVVLSHAPLMLSSAASQTPFPALSAFNAAVDVLFLISGLMAFLGVRRRLRQGQSFAGASLRYYGGRIARIAPLAWFSAFALAMLGTGLSRDVRASDLGAALTFTANVHWAPCFGGAWDRCGDPRFLSHYWALATEALFWLAAPVLVVATRRWATLATAATLIVGLLVPRPWGGAWWAFRWEPFVVGLWLGPLVETARPSLRRLGPASAAEATLMIALAAGVAVLGPSWFGGETVVAVAVLSGWIVLRAAASEPAAESLGGRALRWVAARSYALYLLHPAVYATVGAAVMACAGASVAILATLGASIVIADWATTAVEAPIRETIGRWTDGARMTDQ